jgi:hypothetical protein
MKKHKQQKNAKTNSITPHKTLTQKIKKQMTPEKHSIP